MEDLLKTLVASQQAQYQTHLALLEEQKKANMLKAEEILLQKQLAARDVTPVKAGEFIAKMGASDEIEAYLHAFEATATRERWPKEQWVGLLAPFLTGEALNAVRDLVPGRAKDYDHLKAEILGRHGLTKFGMAQRFHTWTFQPDQPPRAQMHELVRITRKWLEPERNTAAEVVEAIVVDRYLRALPYEAKKIISQQAVATAAQTVEAMEQYQATAEMLRASRKEPSGGVPQTGGARIKAPRVPSATKLGNAPGGDRAATGQWRATRDSEPRQCYRCGELGHISWQCGKPMDQSMPTAESSSAHQAHYASLLGVSDSSQARLLTCLVTVNHQDVEALLDSGSRITLVHRALVDPARLSPEVVLPVSCVHGDTKECPTTELTMTTTRGIIHTVAGVVDSLPVPLLIGLDCPAFHLLWRETQERLTRIPRKRRGKNSPSNTQAHPPESCSPACALVGIAGVQTETESGPETGMENAVPGEDQASSETEDPGIPEPPPFTGQYGTAQLQDPTLSNALRNVQVLEVVVLGDRTSPTYPPFHS